MGQTGQSKQLVPPLPVHKNLQKKKRNVTLCNIVTATSLFNFSLRWLQKRQIVTSTGTDQIPPALIRARV
jgi:hypothetical protein